MLSRRLCTRIATAIPLFAAPAAQGVIFHSTGDSTFNSTAPTGSLLNSGWQYEGIWSGFLGTPVGPNHFLTAAHIGGGTGSPFIYNGVTYTTVAYPDAASYKDFGDLRLYKVGQTFTSYAPLYDATIDGMETAKSVTVFGRGRRRGTEISVGAVQKGWNWGTADGVERWGENKVTSIQDYAVEDDQILLEFAFDSSGDGSSGINEATLAGGDSGGGVFINSNGQWKLAGISYAVSGPYSYGPADATFLGALYDTGGLYDRSADPATLIIDTTEDKPSYWYASRVSTSVTSINSYLNLPPTWNLNNAGVWSNDSNWANTATAPNAVDAIADFRTVITTACTVTVDAPVTVGTLNFDSSQQYTLGGSALLTLDVSGGSATVNVASGNHTISAPVTLNDATILNVIPSTSTLTISGTLTATGKTITKQGLGVAQLSNIRAAGLVISQGGVKVLPNGLAGGVSKLTTLSISPAAKLDLTDNKLITASAVGTQTAGIYDGVQGLVQSGYGSGIFDGTTGIITSQSDATNGSGLTTLGVSTGALARFLGPTDTELWGGQTIDGNSTMVMYTYIGDANLDGFLDSTDYFYIDNGASTPGADGFANGDFNYDGDIDSTDYFYIDNNIVLGLPVIYTSGGSELLAGVTAVPEPASLTVLAIAIGGLLARRRKI